MNKEQYLESLRSNLKNIPQEEVENIVEYYREYLEEAGPEMEQTVMSELGRPEFLAAKASADYVIKDIENNQNTGNERVPVKKQISNLWILVLAICAFPIWLPLGISAAAVVFALVVTVGAVLFAFAVAAIAMIAAGIFATGAGIIALFIHFPTGVVSVGTGLLVIGLGALFMVGTSVLGKSSKKLLINISKIRIGKGGNK